MKRSLQRKLISIKSWKNNLSIQSKWKSSQWEKKLSYPRERNIQQKKMKNYKSRKNYLNVKETKLTKRESTIKNQDKIVKEVEVESKKITLSVSSQEKEIRKYKFMEK